MKTHLLIPMVGIVLAGTLLSAGGCVSKADYDKLMAMNRNATDEKNRAIAAAQELRAQLQQVQEELDNVKKQLAAKQSEIDLLTAQKNDLQKAFDELMGKYKELAGKPPVILSSGPLPEGLNKELEALAAKYPQLLEFDKLHGMVKLKADLTFTPGSDQITAEAKAALAKFVEIVNGPEARQFNVYIAGHTDDLPIVKPETKRMHPDNWYLSVHRSVAVLKEMATVGLAQPRMGAMGFGEYHPIAANAPGHKGNVANRRVEIWIVPPDRFLTLPSVGASDTSSVVAPRTRAPNAKPVTPAVPEATPAAND